MRVLFLFLLTGCVSNYSPSVSSGVWLESDYTSTFNSACPASGIFQNSLNLTYGFGDTSGYTDTGYWYDPSSSSIDAIQTYNQSLWDVCSSSYENARFECSIPAIMTQYDKWKENFPVEQLSQEQNCVVQFTYGYSEGLFIDAQTVRMVNYLELVCTDDPESGQSIRTCSGYISSTWTKQQ